MKITIDKQLMRCMEKKLSIIIEVKEMRSKSRSSLGNITTESRNIKDSITEISK